MYQTIWDFIKQNDRDNSGSEISYRTKPYASWDEIKKLLAKFDQGWIFRGQRCADWPLQTSLETWKENNKNLLENDCNAGNSLELIEQEIPLPEFKREANNYFSSQGTIGYSTRVIFVHGKQQAV